MAAGLAARARAERRPPGRYVRMGASRWGFLPDRLPPRLDGRGLAEDLSQAHRRLAAAARGEGEIVADPEGALLYRPGGWEPVRITPPGSDAATAALADRLARSIPEVEARLILARTPPFVRGTGLRPWLCAVHAAIGEVAAVTGVHGRFRERNVAMASATAFGGVGLYAPPVAALDGVIVDLQAYLHAPGDPLLQAILAGYQIVAAHPFRDGNGRVACVLREAVLHAGGAPTRRDLTLRRLADLNYPALSESAYDVFRCAAWTRYLRLWLSLIEAAAWLQANAVEPPPRA